MGSEHWFRNQSHRLQAGRQFLLDGCSYADDRGLNAASSALVPPALVLRRAMQPGRIC